ncbi:molybdate ABC transporter substrate-binding protein [Algihabitans albus]|uniref:molybdate ABC transporter substrate-binding protein n=1 Tax=Algihabitans albus TaxID=2164067 RepID=UPI000E5CE657|nr:molybdate ABC transporter substrate-binding protein [Algihabitans albus]
MLRSLLALLVLTLASPGQITPAQASERLTVFAAASTTDAVAEVLEQFKAKTGVESVASFASSSTLAKQIEAGAPADLFISANVTWMDHLEARQAIRAETRVDLLGNSLVVVSSRDSDFICGSAAPCDLAAALQDERLAVGDPDHVPAGLYAKEALQSLGQWDDLEPKLAPTSDVRGALALVARGETPAGIVYQTDAALLSDVRVVSTLPVESHSPILYPVALTARSEHPAAPAFLRYLAGPQARAILIRHGFTVVAPPTPQPAG